MLRQIKQEFKQGKTLLTFTSLQATGQVLGMIAPLVVAKFFSPELFGSYSLAKMIVFFFTSILIASAQVPFIVLANQERAKSGKINKAFSVQCTFLILGFCVFVAITLSLSKYITAFAKISCGDLFFVLLAFVGLALKTFLCNLFMAAGQRIKNSLAELVFGSLILALIFVLYFVDRINLRSVFTAHFISSVVAVGIFVKAIDFKILLPFSLEKKYFREMLDFTKWTLLGATAIYFINWGDNLVLRYFVPIEEVGVYNLGYQFFKGTVMLVFILGRYFLPFVSQNVDKPQKMKDYLYRKRSIILLAATVVIVLAYFLVPYLFNLVYGGDYQGSVAVIKILLIATAFSLYNIFNICIFLALKRYKFIQVANIVQVSINVVLNLILVPIMGITGAAVATVLAYFCNVIAIELYFRLRLRSMLKI